MTEKQVKAIFDKYNPENKLVRCPNGKAKLKKSLDKYAQAAVNLYGIINRDEFVRIFNDYNDEQTTADEVFIILLPKILKGGKWYGFYKDYIVHYCILKNFDYADYLEKNQLDKPRYLPPKEEFINYEFEEHRFNNHHWRKLLKYLFDSFKNRHDIIEVFEEIKDVIYFSGDISQIVAIMEEYDLVFYDTNQAQKFFDIVMTAMNNTRIWENKGHTPEEIMGLTKDIFPNEPSIKINRKIGVNEPCPCGSGKKYKKCCKAKENSGMAQLAFNERKLFYETWYKLLEYINQKNKILNYKINPVYPSNHDERQLHVIRNVLWENPKIINEFIKNENILSAEETSLLKSWQKYHIKGEFILIKYEAEYAVFMGTDEKKPALYAVKGMTTSISEAMQHQLPVMIETVLLPFKDKIIYDSFIGSHSLSFGSGMINVFNESYENIKKTSGIITMLQSVSEENCHL
ncbi:MAG: SEC-C metal-binding domain-containing protein [Treponema sp.]|nr:SEC-C metal-binding domain-containing protein [Treponema sp.]